MGKYQYLLEFPSDIILYISLFYYFLSHLHILYKYFLNPHGPTLGRYIFVEAGPRQLLALGIF